MRIMPAASQTLPIPAARVAITIEMKVMRVEADLSNRRNAAAQWAQMIHRTFLYRVPAAVVLAALAACAEEPPAVPEAPPPPVFAPGECDAQAAQFAVGKPYDSALGE